MLASQIMSRVFAEVRAGAAESASKRYIDKMFVGFSDAHGGLTEAALGARDLRDGLATARDGARKLASGTSTANNGGRALADGLGTLAGGASAAATGATSVATGTAALASGLGAAQSGATSVAGGLSQLASGTAHLSGALELLDSGSSTLATSAAALSAGSAQLSAGVADALGEVDDAASGASRVASGAAGVAQALHAYLAEHPEAAEDPRLAAAVSGADALKSGSAQLADGLASAAASAPALAAGARGVAAGASQLSAGAHTLSCGVAQAHAATVRLVCGASALATGASELATGVASAQMGAGTLAAGTARLAVGTRALASGSRDAASGADELAAGIGRIEEGAHTLSSGLRPAVSGAEDLRSGLTSGAAEVPDYNPAQRTANAEMMGNPVELSTTRSGEVPTYGTGFTPYFVPLALWVGALLTYFLIKPLPNRATASGANPLVTAMASYLPGAALGIAQAVILLAVVQFGLGLKPVNVLATYAFAVLTALVFIAILQMLNGAFGAVGKLISIVVLMLQLTSAGGTFPTQMIPSFFQALNPFLPMSYVVSGLRQTISGADMTAASHNAAALLTFGMIALAITTFAAWRKQTFTMERLHPSLSL